MYVHKHVACAHACCKEHAFYKQPSSRPSSKSFLIFGHILVVNVP